MFVEKIKRDAKGKYKKAEKAYVKDLCVKTFYFYWFFDLYNWFKFFFLQIKILSDKTKFMVFKFYVIRT